MPDGGPAYHPMSIHPGAGSLPPWPALAAALPVKERRRIIRESVRRGYESALLAGLPAAPDWYRAA